MTPEETLVYGELCKSYHAIDDFRAKLLGFLPLATGAAIVFGAKETPSPLERFSVPVGIFGFLVALGLFSYEIYGITKCAALLSAGKRIEFANNIAFGQFTCRPDAVFGWINEPFAAGVIYPAVLASWIVVAFWKNPGWWAWAISGVVFFAGLASTLAYDRRLRNERTGSGNL
jgi:hypothetical protein